MKAREKRGTQCSLQAVQHRDFIYGAAILISICLLRFDSVFDSTNLPLTNRFALLPDQHGLELSSARFSTSLHADQMSSFVDLQCGQHGEAKVIYPRSQNGLLAGQDD